jgi:hypothetical protein
VSFAYAALNTHPASCSPHPASLYSRDKCNTAERTDKKRVTYVAFTSSFAGTGGIVDAEDDAEAIVGVVACSGTLFEGDFLRERKPIFGGVRGEL